MKIIFLVSLLYTFVLANTTQVIVGTFSVEKNAEATKKDVTDFIASNAGFSDYLQKHTINVTLKKIGVYYVVALEPMYDYSTLYWVLKRVKEKYNDSYVLKVYKNIKTKELIDNLDEKVDINNTLLFEKTKNVENNSSIEEEKAAIVEQKMQTLKRKDEADGSKSDLKEPEAETKPQEIVEDEVTQKRVEQVVLQQKEQSLVEEYLTEILAIVAILAVIVIYIVVKRKSSQPQKNKEAETLQTIEVIDDEYDNGHEDEQGSSKEELEDFTGQDLMIEKEPEEEMKEESPATESSSRKKREVQPHGKISKEDFSEFAGENIIVAEDNLINQKVIGGLLSESGINVIFANDGQEVLDKLQSGLNASMILMDAHMPNIDGFEATKIIRNDEKLQHIPIVALSGDVAADDVKKMMDSGMDDHLEKPLRMDPLYDAIYAFTSEKEEEKEFDVEKGLEICGGDEGFYHEILTEFVNTYADSDEKIQSFLNSSQKKEADKLLLDITGITANIGADNLHSIAQNLKLVVLKDEYEYIPLLDEYSKHLSILVKQIKEHI